MLRISRGSAPEAFHELVGRPRDELLRWAHRKVDERRQRRAPIDEDLFHSGPLVEMVASAFDGHCAYCERQIGIEDGVGHFRPLRLNEDEAAVAEQAAPGDYYAWLAYEWRNLFLICWRCRTARADRFPVDGKRARFLATHDEVRSRERPSLLDPTREDPANHFVHAMTGECLPKGDGGKGWTTIALFDLNDPKLVEGRRQAIDDAVGAWRHALLEPASLPNHFLMSGAYRGACRGVIARSIAEHGFEAFSISSGRNFHRRLVELLSGTSELRHRLIEAIERLPQSDALRLDEHKRRLDERAKRDMDLRRPVAAGAPRPSTPPPAAELVSLRVSNFRAIDELQLAFGARREAKAGAPCLMLLGENAVGKSTCLSAMALALLGTREARRLKLPYDQLARSAARDEWAVWSDRPVEVVVQLADRLKPATFHYDPVRHRIEGTPEQSAIVLGYGPHRYFDPDGVSRGSGASRQVRSLFYPREPLADPTEWLTNLRGPKFDEVARAMRMILPINDDDDLVNDERVGICVLAQGQLTRVSMLSEGYRSIFAMVGDMCHALLDHWSSLEKARAVVLIDEIETHLHPRWKMQVMSSLRRAFPRVQFIATTHDPLCVRGMDDGEVAVLTRGPDGGVQLLHDLPSVSGMRAEQLLTSDYFGLSSTVDPELQLDIARLAQGEAIDMHRAIGPEASELIKRITVGDTATAQIIQEALLKYLQERERSSEGISVTARPEAVTRVLYALRAARAG